MCVALHLLLSENLDKMEENPPTVTVTNPFGLYDPRPHAYSHVASVLATQRLVFVAGQGGSRIDGVLSDDFR